MKIYADNPKLNSPPLAQKKRKASPNQRGFFIMANVKQGNLTRSPEWWKHLRWCKRVFWKKERKAQQREIAKQI